MLRNKKNELALLFGIAAPLPISMSVVYVIDTYLALNPWNNNDVQSFACFLAGIIFFPGALRRYRVERQSEHKVPWYQRIDLILCLIGLLFGPFFALSIIDRRLEFLLFNGVIIDNRVFIALAILQSIIGVGQLALLMLVIYRAIRQSQSRKEDPPQAT